MIFLASALILSAVQPGLCRTKGKDSNPDEVQNVRAGTKISAQLESAVDAKTVKPGDEVTAKVTHNVKQNGKVVIHKGDRLMGRISNVQAASKSSEGSQLGVTFDRLATGESTTQLNTVVSAVLSSSSGQGGAGDDLPMMGPAANSAPMMSGGGRTSAGGGVIGGATSAIGSTAGVAGSAAGNLGGTVGGAANSTVGGAMNAGVATPARLIHVGSVAATQVESQSATTSSLSTSKGDLRLDSGTRLEFRVAGQGSAQANH